MIARSDHNVDGTPDVARPIKVAALYRFTPFSDCEALRDHLTLQCHESGVRGTLLLAPEGINGTIAGLDTAIDRVIESIRAIPGCVDLDVRESRTGSMPFHRMKVRIKREIVTMGEPDVDPLQAGSYVAPQDWNALIAEPGTVLIDTRNQYEVAIGSFDGAINPGTQTFGDFPSWFRIKKAELMAQGHKPKIAMFCTGGIRCEKATAFVKSEGIEDVFHLKGGILNYLDSIPSEASRWQGECFVFDERVAVTHGLGQGTHGLCRSCRMPIGPQDRTSALYREGVSCPKCHASRNEDQRAGYAERHRQTELAQRRGKTHIGTRQLPET